MIATEDGLHWHIVLRQSDPAQGGSCTTWRCVEHRRVLWMKQRPNRDAECVETWSVDGIPAQFYHSAEAAIAAMRANP